MTLKVDYYSWAQVEAIDAQRLEKCKSAGFKIKGVNQDLIRRERVAFEVGKCAVL
jgi:hypothetical protein